MAEKCALKFEIAHMGTVVPTLGITNVYRTRIKKQTNFLAYLENLPLHFFLFYTIRSTS